MITDPNDADQLRAVLDRIHAVMSIPFDWSADTPEAVGNILTGVGYSFPKEETVTAWYEEDDDPEPDLSLYRPWCPATGAGHVWTDDVDPRYEHLAPRDRVHCDECGQSPSKELLKEWDDAVGS